MVVICGVVWIKQSVYVVVWCCFFFSSRRRHTRFDCDWSSDVCSSDLMYVEYWFLYSERRRQDLKLAWMLLAFPGFTFLTRCWNAIATLNELLGKSHLESAMAPSWVLRRTKF